MARILVIDDEPLIGVMVEKGLKGHQVVACTSAQQAQELLATDQAFDVVLCDVMMPRMTGVDFHAWLVNAHPALADRLTFITAGVYTAKEQDYLRAAKRPIVEKPFGPRDILKILP